MKKSYIIYAIHNLWSSREGPVMNTPSLAEPPFLSEQSSDDHNSTGCFHLVVCSAAI